ncbi:HIT family protein [Rothia sp. ZJ1223]|uniref:HIT family protein n=1 Tax=Rothia sp. ZJ1223 TaxID=2811098 RepID=UPI0019565748|nr:HIT family protein [Rothia sp. ZJ1223]MBM7051043.1 HIT family protein [Rothia sp. ZJ1223]
MSTIFTKIIEGELPGRFVWKDDEVVVFLTIEPLAQGHVLVVPRAEIEHWVDMPLELSARVFEVAHTVGKAINTVWQPAKVGVEIVGLDVPHVHVHVFPAKSIQTFNFAHAEKNPDAVAMDESAQKIRDALRAAGHGEFVPES